MSAQSSGNSGNVFDVQPMSSIKTPGTHKPDERAGRRDTVVCVGVPERRRAVSEGWIAMPSGSSSRLAAERG